jgi:hypothetical protein
MTHQAHDLGVISIGEKWNLDQMAKGPFQEMQVMRGGLVKCRELCRVELCDEIAAKYARQWGIVSAHQILLDIFSPRPDKNPACRLVKQAPTPN